MAYLGCGTAVRVGPAPLQAEAPGPLATCLCQVGPTRPKMPIYSFPKEKALSLQSRVHSLCGEVCGEDLQEMGLRSKGSW